MFSFFSLCLRDPTFFYISFLCLDFNSYTLVFGVYAFQSYVLEILQSKRACDIFGFSGHNMIRVVTLKL